MIMILYTAAVQSPKRHSINHKLKNSLCKLIKYTIMDSFCNSIHLTSVLCAIGFDGFGK